MPSVMLLLPASHRTFDCHTSQPPILPQAIPAPPGGLEQGSDRSRRGPGQDELLSTSGDQREPGAGHTAPPLRARLRLLLVRALTSCSMGPQGQISLGGQRACPYLLCWSAAAALRSVSVANQCLFRQQQGLQPCSQQAAIPVDVAAGAGQHEGSRAQKAQLGTVGTGKQVAATASARVSCGVVNAWVRSRGARSACGRTATAHVQLGEPAGSRRVLDVESCSQRVLLGS